MYNLDRMWELRTHEPNWDLQRVTEAVLAVAIELRALRRAVEKYIEEPSAPDADGPDWTN